MQIHYHGSGGEAEASQATSALAGPKGGSATFLDIHYHGDQAALATNPAVSRPGSSAFVDIHYHGDSAAGPAANPALSKAGSAAFLDIHYHGDQAALGGLAATRGIGEGAQAEGGLVSSSSAVSNALAGRRPAATTPSVGQPGGGAAFLDIHYHGSSPADLAASPALGKGGSAAFLDIHYHGDQALGGIQPEAGLSAARPSPSLSPTQTLGAGALGPKGGSAAFLDIHYHGKSISDAEVQGLPGLHIGDAALLDIHYHG